VSFRDVPGQSHAVAFFRRAVESGRLAHAYILVGPEGVGRRGLARALAQFVFCSERTDDACGHCRSCRLIASGGYPDVHWYRREEGKQQLRVEVIKEFLREVNLKPLESDRKVFVVEDADKLNAAGANRLLKVLEEPPPESLLVLLALDVRDFLPTILSRCHVIRLRPLPVEELSGRLEREQGCSAVAARYLSHFTMGSPGLAAGLAKGNFFEERAQLIDLVISLREGEHFAAAEEMFNRAGGKDDASQGRRERLLQFIDVIALFYHDVLSAALDRGAVTLVNADRAEDVAELARRLSPERVSWILKRIEAARQAVAFNANQKLLLENLAFDLAQMQ